MNERGSETSAFIVFECLETLMKHEARVYRMASPKGLIYFAINTKAKQRSCLYLVFAFLCFIKHEQIC